MKKITLILITLVFSTVVNSQDKYGKITFNKAVNIAGKQRMLSQKISKLYLYSLINPNDASVTSKLTASKLIFEKHNEILLTNATSSLTKEKIEIVNDIWGKLKNIFDKKPNYEGAKKIISTNTLLLGKTNEVVESIIASSTASEEDIELKKVINIAGKQRMLAQRLGLYYFANEKRLQTEKTMSVLESTYTKLDDTVAELLISDFNTDEIEETLASAMVVWQDVRDHKNNLLKQKFDNTDIYKKSDELTKVFNKLTLLYEKVK